MSWADEYPDTPEPKHYTRRDPSRRTHGWRVAEIAAALGKPLMPWQRYVVDVALEYDAEGYVYEDVLVTVPRQSGKTTLVGPVQLDRVIFQQDAHVFYTAQTQKDARKRFDDLVALVQGSPFRGVAKVRLSSGSERITFPSGSSVNLFAPKKDALHGETPPLVVLDEIWALDEATGRAIYDDAIKPAQFTLAGNRQRWQISTAGTSESVYMRRFVDLGRKGAPRMAYFEWSLPDGMDPYAPESVAAFHPAVGHTATVADVFAIAGRLPDGTIDPALSDEDVMSHASYLRGMCNVWTEQSESIISAEDWARLAVETPVPSRRDVVVSFDVNLDNASASVLATWRDEHGDPRVRTLHTAPGTTWLRPLIKRIADEWSPKAIAADDGGPARAHVDALEREGVQISRTPGRDFATACDGFLTSVLNDRTLGHDGSRTLSEGMAHLAVVDRGDSRYISRSRSTGPVAGPVAAAVGMWVYDHAEAPMPAAFIYS